MTGPSFVTKRDLLRASGAAALAFTPTFPGVASAQENKTAAQSVRIITTEGVTGLTLQNIIKSQKYMESFGLSAETINVSDASKAIAALFSGSADICMWSGLNGVLSAIEKGGRLRIVGGALLFPTHVVLSSRPNIQTVEDLRGKTIGVGALGAQLHLVMLALLRKKGIDPSEVTFRNVGSSADVFRAIVSGTVDAGPCEVDLLGLAQKSGAHPLSDSYLWKEVPEFVFQAAYATVDAIKNKRETLARSLAAYGRVYRFVQDPSSKDIFTRAQMLASGHNDPAESLRQWEFIQKYKPYDVNLVLTKDSIQFMQQLNVEVGLQKRVLPFEEVADMSLAESARQMLDHA